MYDALLHGQRSSSPLFAWSVPNLCRYFIDPRKEDLVSAMNAWLHKLLRFFVTIGGVSETEDTRRGGEVERATRAD